MISAEHSIWVASIVLVATYAIIMTEKVNRAIVALFFAGLLIILGVINQETAIRGVDFNTIGLLIGMMVIVSITRKSGVFQYMAIWSAKLVKANPAALMFMLQIVTAVVSSLLDNVTTVLLVVPVTMVICDKLEIKVMPFLISQIFASNIGGTATLIGDPPNILIGSSVGIPFNDFVVNLAPIIVVVQLVTGGIFHMLWGRKLHATPAARKAVMDFNENEAITDKTLLVQALFVMGAVIVAFVTTRYTHLEPGTIGLFGAAVLMLVHCIGRSAEEQSEKVIQIFNEVEWITIFFFVGLFIVVAGVEHVGLLKMAAEKLLQATGGNMLMTTMAILWASAILSSIIDNIPFVATMIPLIKSMAPAFGGPENLMPLWWALSLGACLGGNGTLVGASANLTVAGMAERAGTPIRFVAYMKVAYPIMLVSIVISMVYLYARFF